MTALLPHHDFTDAYVHHAVLVGFGQSFTVVDEIKEFELVSFVGSNITDRVWFAPFVFSSSGANQAGDNFEVFSIEIENITDEARTNETTNATTLAYGRRRGMPRAVTGGST